MLTDQLILAGDEAVQAKLPFLSVLRLRLRQVPGELHFHGEVVAFD